MPDTSPAELLRAAASLMRERAQAALDGPWLSGREANHLADNVIYGQSRDWPGHIVQVANVDYGHNKMADSEHIISWHPGVALAVADWLQLEAAQCAVRGGPDLAGHTAYALALARTYLGDSDA